MRLERLIQPGVEELAARVGPATHRDDPAGPEPVWCPRNHAIIDRSSVWWPQNPEPGCERVSEPRSFSYSPLEEPFEPGNLLRLRLGLLGELDPVDPPDSSKSMKMWSSAGESIRRRRSDTSMTVQFFCAA